MKYSTHTLFLSLILLSGVVLTSCNRRDDRHGNNMSPATAVADMPRDPIHSRATVKAGQEKHSVDSTSSKKSASRIITSRSACTTTHKVWRLSSGILADLARRTVSKFFSNADSDTLCVGRAQLAVPREAMAYGKVLSITPLRRDELPDLPTGMVNVTGGCDTLMARTDTVSGYRFLPHGNHFVHHLASISVPYDSTLIPKGYTADDIHTYYYDGQHRRWTMLQSKGIDTRREVAMAETSHFTDVINGIIKVPESPETQNYVPTGISELRAADPAAGIRQIEAPTANQNGTASLSYPFETPAGRNDISAGAGLQYSSDGGSSFVGYGWSLPMQSIDIETRWGVPRFDEKYESESYLLMGQQLGDRLYRRTDSLTRQADKAFRPMVESSFSKIVRRGNSPKNYFWEVTAKDGTTYSYGGYNGQVSDETTLTDGKGNRIKWVLQRITDVHGNFAAFHYTKTGNNLYPNKYTYTGYGSEEGLYSIEFDVDSTGSFRKDVEKSGRLGILQTDKALLKRVTVKNNGRQLRAYLMNYASGVFGKTMLTGITELDSKNDTVDKHKFDYYQDVTGPSNLFSKDAIVYTAEQEDYGRLVKSVVGNFTQTLSLLGGGSAKGNTVGGGVMVGAGWGPASVNAGASYSHTKSSNEGRVALVDINGDGMPDKVWKDRHGLHYRLNQNYDLGHPSFGEQRDIEGISNFSQGTVTSHSLNANVATGFGPGSAGYAVDKTTDQSKTKVYFQDFNSDGLIDIACNGTVYFNHSDGETVKFQKSSANTKNQILSASRPSLNQTFVPDYEAIRDSLEQEYPLHDVVRVWRAPYTGTIQVTGRVSKPSDSGDGVSLSMQFNSDIVWQDTLLQSGTVDVPVLTRSVSPGDYITFRVGARYSGMGDEVEWDPAITYTSMKVDRYAGSDLAHYQSGKDYIHGEYSTAAIAEGRTNRFDGTFSKQKTSDDVTLAVIKTDKDGNQTVLDSLTLKADTVVASGTFAGTITAVAGEAANVDFMIRTGSPIDWQQVDWSPAFYTDTTKYVLAPQRMMFNKNIVLAPDTVISARLSASESHLGKGLTLMPRLTVSRTSDKDTAPATVHLTIKDDKGSLLYRKELSLGSNNRLSADSIHIKDGTELARKMTAGKVQVTFSILNELSSATAALEVLRDSVDSAGLAAPAILGKVKIATVNASVYSSYNRFDVGLLYKGWGEFAWNGTRRFSAIPKEQMKVQDSNSYYHDGHIDENAVEANGMDINKQAFFTMSYQPKADRFVSATDSAFITFDTMRPSRLGEDDIVVDSVDYALDGDGLPAPVLLTESKSKGKTYNLGFSLGASIGVNKSHSKQESYTRVSAMDLNGDGYPDWLSDHDGKVQAQLTTPTGTLGNEELQYDVALASTKGEASNIGGEIGLSSNPDDYSFKNFNSQMAVAKTAFAKAKTDKEVISDMQANSQGASHSGIVSEFSCAASGNFSSGTSETVQGWEDLNGDGLPDMVTAGKVRYGLGYNYSAETVSGLAMLESSKSGNFGDGLGICIPVLGLFSINAGQNDTEDLTSTQTMLSDVNGDGLPDLLRLDGSDLKVTLNTGDGFMAEDELYKNHNISNNLGSSVAYYGSTAYTFTIHLPFGFRINITPSIQASHSESVNRTVASLMDIDGDGLPDLVYSNSDSRLVVHRNLAGRTNLLRTMTLPFGGHIHIGYAQTEPSFDMPGRRWVMSSVETTGGYKENGATSTRNEFTYEGGYRDRRERDFYGFRKVTTRQIDTEKGSHEVYRYSVDTYGNNRDYYLHNLVTDESLFDKDGKKLQGAIYTYELNKINDTPACAGTIGSHHDNMEVLFPALAEVVQSNFDETSGDSLTTKVENTYDDYGNLLTYQETAAGEQLDAKIDYHRLTDKYIVSVPSHITVSSGGRTYRERSTKVDGNGEITEITLHNGDKPSVYDMKYDSYGNITRLTKPENYKGERMFYAYTYDDLYHSLVTKVSDAYGYSSTTTYDGLWNVPATTTDLNGQRMEYTYDALGRQATIRAPYEIESGQPFTIKFEYFPKERKAHTIHYTQDGNIDTYTFADSIMRAVQTKQTGLVWNGGSASKVSIVSGRAVLDAFGRNIASYYPTTESYGNIGTYNTATGDLQAKTEYDTHDRTTEVTLADGSTTKSAYTIGSHDGVPMLETKVTDALGRTAESYTDEKGRNRETVQHAGGENITVRYAYNPVNEVTTVTHPNGRETKYEYDQLGRKLMVSHPDAGETDMTYDAAGNLLTKLTAQLRKSISEKGCITYTYDYERLKEVLYPENLFNRVTYTYGQPGDKFGRAGRLTLVEDASGGEAYYYGRQGEVTKTVRTVMASVADIRTYVYGATYDSWNRVRTMTYPDGEVVTYHYNAAGQVESLTSNKQGKESTIVAQIGYDKDGHTVYQKLGNGTETTYTYDKQRERLQDMTLTGSGSTLMQNKYRYDAVDNILGITNAANPQGLTKLNKAKLGGASTHSYQYDELNRLIHATGKAKSATYDMAMTFGRMSEPLTKVQKVDSSLTAKSYNFAYKYEDDSHPTAPTQIGHDHYTYDANGNPTLVTNDSTNTTREMYWDEDNRLMVLSDNGKTSRYTYNAGGERIMKSYGTMEGVYINGAPQGITFHETDNFTLYPASILTVNKNRFTKHYFIGNQRIASRIGTGTFNNVYGVNGSYITAGQQDYAERMNQIESQKEAYYKELGIAPGVPTEKGAYGDPENTGVGYNTIITNLGDHSVPDGWVQTPKHNTTDGSTPGTPISWNDPSNPDDPQAGYGYIANDTTAEETFFFHSDHLGSTSYITDDKGNITQYDAYLPYGELLVDEHSSSEEMPYKFNGKEFDEETGLYYYGARYMNSIASIWYGVDPLKEKYNHTSPYVYGGSNPVKIIDPNGKGWVETQDKHAYWDDRVNSEKDNKYIPKGGRFLGNTVDMFDDQGQYKFGDAFGEIHSSHPLDEVVVTGDKDYKFHHSFGYRLFGDFRNSDQGYGPWNPDAISFGVGANITIFGEAIGIESGFIMTGGMISPYFTLFGGFDAENISSFLKQKGSMNPLKQVSINAYGNFVMYENLNKKDLNPFDSYRELGIINGLSVGNLGFSYGTSATQSKNGYYKTNLSRSYGVSLNVNPARFDVSREGGYTWIPFY